MYVHVCLCFACVSAVTYISIISVYRSVLCDVAVKVNLFAREVTVDVVQSLGAILKHGSAVVKGVSQSSRTAAQLWHTTTLHTIGCKQHPSIGTNLSGRLHILGTCRHLPLPCFHLHSTFLSHLNHTPLLSLSLSPSPSSFPLHSLPSMH